MINFLTNKIYTIIGMLLNNLLKGGREMGTRLDELIIYISEKSADDPNYGSTKLNKILFAADFYHYGYYGKSISRVEYQHIQNGPAPVAMKPALGQLQAQGRIDVIEKDHHGYNQKRIVAKDVPDLSSFTSEEIEFVDEFIEKFKPYNGTELSNWTHELLPWLLTSHKERIPYESVFTMYDLPPGREGTDWALTELKKLRECEQYDH